MIRIWSKLSGFICRASFPRLISVDLVVNIILIYIQNNFNGSNTFGTLKICSRQRQFELMSVNHNARSGGILEIYYRFSLT